MKNLLLGFILSAIALPAARITIVPSSQTSTPGQPVTVAIHITDVTDLYGFQFDVGWDPAILEPVDVADGGFLSGANFFEGFETPATLTFISGFLSGPVSGVTGSGTLARLEFQGTGAGTSPVSLRNVILFDSGLSDIQADTSDGEIHVVPESATGLIVVFALIGIVGTRTLLTHSR